MDSPFIIDSCTSGVSKNINNRGILCITDIQPNPASESVLIKYRIKSNIYNRPLILYISNELGKILVKKYYTLNNLGTNNSLKLNIGKLSQGNYYLTLKIGSFTDMKALKIIK